MLVALFRVLSFIPLPILHGMGAILGWVVFLFSPSYRQRLKENCRQAGFTKHIYSSVSEAGKSILELAFIWCAPPKKVLKKAKIENWEIVQKALDARKGIIFLTPHLGCFEISAQSVAAKTPITVLYRPPRKKILQPLMEGARKRPGLQLAPANLGGVRNLLKTLKNGAAIGLLPDQVPQQGEGVWANFFGRPAYTMTLSAKLHSMTGAPIILAYAERLSFGRGFVIRFIRFDSIHPEPLNGSPEQRAGAINLAMEKLIARCPAQYFWSYNRYKTPPNIAAAPVVSPNVNAD